MNFAEYVALLSGNTDLLEKVRLEKKLADLERSYQVFMKRKSEVEFNIKLIRNGQEMKAKALARLESDWKPFQGVDMEKLSLTIGGKTVADKKEAGSQLQTLIAGLQNDQSAGKETVVANLQGFDMIYNHQKALVHVKGMSGQIYNYASGNLNEDPALAGRYLHDCVKRIPKLIDNEKVDFQRSIGLVETYSKELVAEFKDMAMIRPLKQQIEELNQRIEKATARIDIISTVDRDQSLIHDPKSVRKQRLRM